MPAKLERNARLFASNSIVFRDRDLWKYCLWQRDSLLPSHTCQQKDKQKQTRANSGRRFLWHSYALVWCRVAINRWIPFVMELVFTRCIFAYRHQIYPPQYSLSNTRCLQFFILPAIFIHVPFIVQQNFSILLYYRQPYVSCLFFFLEHTVSFLRRVKNDANITLQVYINI